MKTRLASSLATIPIATAFVRPRYARALRSVLALSASLVLLAGCDLADNGQSDECPSVAIASDLTRVLYWGGDDSTNWAPNRGSIVGSFSFVQWLSADRLIAATSAVQAGDSIRGLAEVFLDSNREYVSVELHRFDPEIWDIRVDRDSKTIYLLYFATPASLYPTLGRADISGDGVLIDSVLVDESWKPWGAAPHPSADEIIICATSPGDSDDGFYRVDPVNSEPSRILDCFLTKYGARGTEVGPDSTLYFLMHFAGNGMSLIVQWNMQEPASYPLVIAQPTGVVDRLIVNPADETRLLIHRRVYGVVGRDIVGDVIEEMSVVTNETTRRDVRVSTESCRTVRNGFPDWAEDGEVIAFPGGAGVGVEEPPLSLWIKGPLLRRGNSRVTN